MSIFLILFFEQKSSKNCVLTFIFLKRLLFLKKKIFLLILYDLSEKIYFFKEVPAAGKASLK